MNPMMKRMDAIEAAHAARDGDCLRCCTRKDESETEEQARERLGLVDWPGTLVLMLPGDENL